MADDAEVRPLDVEDDRASFRSGDADLDRFFHRFAGQNQFRHHIGTTYVAVAGGTIAGYATVAAAHLEAEELAPATRRRLPAYPVPVLRLARLAVDERARGGGIGPILLRAVFVIALRMSEEVGCIGVVVDAKPHAVAFYERYGFTTIDVRRGVLGDRPEPVMMFLALRDLPPA